MKKILFLLLFTIASYGQAVFDEGIQITGNANSATATKVNVQEANGKVNTQTINTGFNKNIGLGGTDVVGANTLLNQYSTTPIDWTATTFSSGQVVFYGGKQWIAKMATVAGDVPSVSSKWEGITFESLANKTVIVDAIPTDGSNNAVSSNGVFDALATKAPISSVHNPVTLGTANGLSLATQQLSLGLASSGTAGALSGTDWNTFNGKFNTPTGLTTNYLPKWNGSGFGFGNSQIFDNGGNVGIGTNTPYSKLEVAGSIRSVMVDTYPTIGATNYGSVGFPLVILRNVINSVEKSWNIENGRIVNGDLGFYNEGGQRITFKNNGRVLINKTDDDLTNQLQVAGTISASPATTANQVVVKSQLDAFVPSGTVNLTGTQTVAGVKTFSNAIIGTTANFSGTVTVPDPINPLNAATKQYVDAVAARPYKVYTAVLTQQNTNAPSADVLENTLGGTVVWTRNSTGNYYGTLNSAFPIQNKIALFQGGDMWGTLPLKIIRVQHLNSNTIQIFTQQATDGALVDSSLSGTSIEIRVYL